MVNRVFIAMFVNLYTLFGQSVLLFVLFGLLSAKFSLKVVFSLFHGIKGIIAIQVSEQVFIKFYKYHIKCHMMQIFIFKISNIRLFNLLRFIIKWQVFERTECMMTIDQISICMWLDIKYEIIFAIRPRCSVEWHICHRHVFRSTTRSNVCILHDAQYLKSTEQYGHIIHNWTCVWRRAFTQSGKDTYRSDRSILGSMWILFR